MTEARDAGQPNDHGATEDAWVVDGLRVGASLDAAHVVLVLGDDPRRTALAALGVARAQSSHRRVALGDLLGDAEPIQQLLNGEDLHGLSDSFVFGVSLNKIAQPVPQYGELYVLPSGAEVPAYEDIFTNARWKRLAAGFRETGALLVVAAPAHAAHVADVVGLADGAILVGEAQLADVNVDKLLGRVRAPEPNEDATPASDDVAITTGSPAPPWWRRLPVPPAAAGIGLALAIALGGIGVWLAARPLASGHEPSTVVRRRNMGAAAGAVLRYGLVAILLFFGAFKFTAAEANGIQPLIANSPFLSWLYSVGSVRSVSNGIGAVELAIALLIATRRFAPGLSALGGVQIWLQANQRDLPGATFSPIIVRGERWYRALAGSYATRAEADSLLAVLRRQGQLGAGYGEVLRAPLSFLVDSIKSDAVPAMLKYFAGRGQAVYALRQADGSARLYADAFESPQDAALFIDEVRSSGIRPVLVYRIGRVY